jgi:hypothetical protein
MSVFLSPVGGAGAQFFDNNGNPLTGGKLYTYIAGTTTPQATYTGASGNTAHANPIVLDAGGRVPGGEIWLTDAVQYKFVIKTSVDVLIGTYDNVDGNGSGILSSLASPSGSSLVGYLPAGTGAVATTVQSQLRTFTGFGGGSANVITTNQASGVASLGKTTTGYENTATGYFSLSENTTGFLNTAFGHGTLTSSTTGSNNTAVGATSLNLNTTGGENTAVGCRSLSNNTTGNYNTAVGQGALFNNLTGNLNAAFGYHALLNNTTGAQNTALGDISLEANTTGNGNVAVGFTALLAATTATGNTAVGTSSQQSTITGGNNTSVGYLSLYYNTSTGNTAIGSNAAVATTTGYDNTAVGTNSFITNTTGFLNTAVGRDALSLNLTGANNVAVGYAAGNNNSTGSNNVSIGRVAGYSSTVDNNVAVGAFSLQNTTTGTNNTAVGTSAMTGNITFSNCSALGANAGISASNQIQLGDSATTTYVYGTVQNRSDLNDKADVRDTVLGLDFINALRPVDYKWDMREDYRDNPLVSLAEVTRDGSKKRNRYHHGLIAQEVQALITSSGVDFGGFQDHTKLGGDAVLSIGYDELIAPLIKAVQELTAKNKILFDRITILETK